MGKRNKTVPFDPAVERGFIEDKVDAMQKLILVEHRDRKGELTPLYLNNCQTRLHALFEKVRAFRIVKNMLLSDDCEEIAKVIGISPKQKFSTLVRKISQKNIDALLHNFKQKAPHLQLSDGPVRIVITKCRRAGVSSYIGARFYLEANFTSNMSVLVMAHRGANARRIFKYTKDFYDYWSPEYDEYRKQAQYKSRSEGYTWEHNSRYVVASAGGDNSARGDQFDLMHLSESAFFESYAEVNSALTAAPPYSTVIEESTGNGPSGGFYERWTKALDIDDIIAAHDHQEADTIQNWNGYIRFFYSWLDDPAYREKVFDWERQHIEDTLDADEKALLSAFPKTTLEQIKWRRTKIENDCQANEQGLPPELYFAQEFPSTADESFQATSTKWFPQRKLQRMQLRSKTVKPELCLKLDPNDDPKKVPFGMQNFTVWSKPKKGHTYVIGADVSQGLKRGDWSVALVFDRHDGTFVSEAAMLRIKTPAPAFGEMLCLLAEWYNEAFIVPEANGPGLAACTRVVENRYPHIYHRRTMDMIKGRVSDPNTFRFGFLVTASTKTRVLADTQEAIRTESLNFLSEELIKEHLSFESNDGKMQAPKGQHDDTVMATAMAFFGHTRAAPPVDRKAQAAAAAQTSNIPQQNHNIWEAVLAKIAHDTRNQKRENKRESVRNMRKYNR
tara:strand:- start:5515 stop:7533 length:2019 start_codon:yes stop_codon:yes gene_type:complete